MRNEQTLAHVEHRVVQIIRAHDQLRRGLCLGRDLGQDVPTSHDVFLLFGRTIIGKQDLGVHVAEEIFRFLEVETAGVFLEEENQGVPRFRQPVFLSKLGRRLKFRAG